MNSRCSILTLAAFLFSPTALAEESFSSGNDYEKSKRFIVKYKDESLEYEIRLQNAIEDVNGDVLESFSSPQDIQLLDYGKFLIKANAEVMYFNSEEEMKAVEEKEDVEYVELDHKVYLLSEEEVPYGIKKVKALLVPDTDVSNRKVCIIDTGYDITHPDLTSDLTIVTGYEGPLSAGDTPWSYDGNGHGTHVAGTIAAIEGNEEGVVGVNRNGELKLHIVKVFNDNGDWAWGSNLLAAVDKCVDAGANIINMSLGGGGYSQTESDTYERVFKQNDVLAIAAAGNFGNSAYSYPASYEYVMSVAATDVNNRIASFSQHNNQVDIAAPGKGILSTIPLNVSPTKYRTLSGTSMATPHVSGVAALVWSRNPTKSAAEIRRALEDSAEDLGDEGRDDYYGHGLVRADRAAALLDLGFTLSPTSAPTPDSCTDDPIGWFDIDGPDYNCKWYGSGTNCETYGNGFENFGKTANEACCACGGGTESTITPSISVRIETLSPAPTPTSVSPSKSSSTSPSTIPTGMPSITLSSSPSSSFSVTPTSVCTDYPLGWFDADGDKFDCEWYAEGDNCEKYGNGYENLDKTANEACCTCGGGVALSQVPSTLSKGPSATPSASASSKPSEHPSDAPSVGLTGTPSLMPSLGPSASPTSGPTIALSKRPSSSPSASASSKPSEHPSNSPSVGLTATPTMIPSGKPFTPPSSGPTIASSKRPSSSPSASFSTKPSERPSISPSAFPTVLPSLAPSLSPSASPSSSPQVKSPLFTPMNCPAGTRALQIMIKTDGKGSSDSSFRVSRKDRNGKFKKRIWKKENLPDNKTKTFEKCLPSNACYKFYMLDRGGDGMCCNHGEGGYIFSWNDTILKDTLTDLSFTSGKRSVSRKFGDDC